MRTAVLNMSASAKRNTGEAKKITVTEVREIADLIAEYEGMEGERQRQHYMAIILRKHPITLCMCSDPWPLVMKYGTLRENHGTSQVDVPRT